MINDFIINVVLFYLYSTVLEANLKVSNSRTHLSATKIQSTRSPVVVASLLILFGFFGISPAHAQIELSGGEKSIVDLATTAGSNIPVVGPFLSLASLLIFAEESQPGYEAMKKEWQNYTDQKITAERLSEREMRLKGYRELIREIDGFTDPLNKLDSWESLESSLTIHLDEFRSKETEPAEPGLPFYAGALSLHLDALDQLIILTEKLRAQDFQNARANFTALHAKSLEAEIEKAASERFRTVRLDHSRGHSMMGPLGTYTSYEAHDGDKILLKSDSNTDADKLVTSLRNDFVKRNTKLLGIKTGLRIYVTHRIPRDVLIRMHGKMEYLSNSADRNKELQALFEPFGTVQSVKMKRRLPRNMRSPVFFVKMEHRADGLAALAAASKAPDDWKIGEPPYPIELSSMKP
jgi:hypothetical protein